MISISSTNFSGRLKEQLFNSIDSIKLCFSDVNMLTGKRLPNAQGKVVDLSNFRDQDWYSPGKGEPYYREYPPRDQRLGYDINGNRYNQSGTTYQQGGIRDPYGGQYTAVKTTDALGRQLSLGEYGYDTQPSNQLRDGFYNYQSATDKNYNQSSRYGSNMYRDDLSYPRDRRFTDDLRNPASPFGRYRNHNNNNKNDPGWRDPSQDRRRRREQDRYYVGDRELPPTPNMTRRHSWDAYDESGYARGERDMAGGGGHCWHRILQYVLCSRRGRGAQ